MPCRKVILGLALLAMPSLSSAQLDVILAKDDTVLGLGGVTDVATIDVNDAKMWVSLVSTTFPDNFRDGCILRNGFLTLREGVGVTAPVGGSIASWGAINLNNKGDMGMLVSVRPAAGLQFTGAYWNLKPVALEDTPVNSPIVPAGTLWESMNVVKLTDGNQVFVLGKTDLGSGARKDTLVRYQLDALGNVIGETVLAYPGMQVPILQSEVASLATAIVTSFAVNKHGDWITFVGAVGTSAVMINLETVVAQEGFPSPVPGRNWTILSQTRTAINDRGDYVFSGSAGINVINKNGAKFAAAGDIIPAFSTNPISGGTAAPIEIANTGDVFWRAQVGAAGSGTEAAIMRNHEPIVVLNRTIVDGKLVNKLEADGNAFASSPNGRFVACRVELGNDPTVLFADFGLVLDIPGCSGNPGTLAHQSGKPVVGDHLELSMDNAQGVGALAKIVFSTRQRIPGSDCGVNGPFGEILTSGAHRVGVVNLPPWDGTGPTSVDIPIPNELSLVDGVFFAQGYFRMPATRNIRLTNGMRIELGAP